MVLGRRRVSSLLAILWTFAMFFLELLDLQNVGLTIMCHDKTSIQILGSKSLSSGEAINWQKTKTSHWEESSSSSLYFMCFVLVF